jgi:hypothetical protein
MIMNCLVFACCAHPGLSPIAPIGAEQPVPLELPNQWLWDIVDEFVYQFQSYCQVWASANEKREGKGLVSRFTCGDFCGQPDTFAFV